MKRTESEFIFAKFFDAYDESVANTKPTLGILGVYQLFHDENGHWCLFKQNMGIDCDKHKDQDHADVLIESEDILIYFGCYLKNILIIIKSSITRNTNIRIRRLNK